MLGDTFVTRGVVLPGSNQVLRLSPERFRAFFRDCDEQLGRAQRLRSRWLARRYGVSHSTVYDYLRRRSEIEACLDAIERGACG